MGCDRDGRSCRSAAPRRRGRGRGAKNSAQESAYLLASSENTPRALEWLLANGGELNDKDSFNGTALIRAVERGQARSVGLLIQKGIDLNHANNLGWQASHEAIWLGSDEDGHVDTIFALIAAGAELDRPSTPQGKTPRQMAEEKGHARQLAALTSAESPVDAYEANATLLSASRDWNAVLAARALRDGADLETRDESDRTPLLLAATHDRLEAARLLVHLGADVNAVDNQRDTHWLVTGVTGSVEMGTILSWAHPDLKARNRHGGISVIPASERGHVDYVKWVVQNTDTDVNHVNDLAWTTLLEAIILGDEVESLIVV
ncbi:hypothetical protein BSZ39_12725 [Bowdeniella nasicola]|uniref:Uncharacterized protein n=1 Tax=Bowdeniella nasicola TaxID=208480 RepID=A0A1Q5PVV1_9ACTO|nr:ankyrin repeat domain-containing protein [Bowdeniella nasicola]OKL51626.1 hypothetical protein BSZ39_12725 [Bowdeniella nasicola]